MKTILIADDDAAILDAMAMILEDVGYTIATTTDGNEVVALQKAIVSDLILLDIQMSGVNGLDICKQFKSKEATKRIPIIMVSANKDGRRTSINAGADDFICKPFLLDIFLQKIKNQLNE